MGMQQQGVFIFIFLLIGYVKHLTQIIYKKFQFLFLSHFVENARRSFGYGSTFRLVREKNIPEILLITL